MNFESKLKDIKCQLSEHFPEYLLIVKPASHRTIACSSDETWAKGAAERFMLYIDENDRINQRLCRIGDDS